MLRRTSRETGAISRTRRRLSLTMRALRSCESRCCRAIRAHRGGEERFVPASHVDGEKLADFISDHALARIAQHECDGNLEIGGAGQPNLSGDNAAGDFEKEVDLLAGTS